MAVGNSICRRVITRTAPFGCDTFVAFPPASPDGVVVFGKNSDRPNGEGQSIRRYPAGSFSESAVLQCTYLSIPQVCQTYAVLLSQIDWMWGCEHGTNECGVVIGNEAVWTKVEDENLSTERLLGMDLVRLGLERGSTSKEAMEVVTNLLETHGQGGPCAENDPSFTYHNSFLIADANEAWILETAGRHWVAQKVTTNTRNISNTLTIRTDYELCSDGLEEYAKRAKLWDGVRPLDWAKCFGEGAVEECESRFSRQGCGRALLQKHDGEGTLNHKAMMEILRDHDSGICMHGGFETTASMVSELAKDGSHLNTHWMMDTPNPCRNRYTKQPVVLEDAKQK